MRISPEEIDRIARLAGLVLSPAERDALVEQLGSVLDHLDALRRVEPDPAPPSPPAAPLRDDQVAFDPLQRPPSELAPAWGDGLFLVPRLSAMDSDA